MRAAIRSGFTIIELTVSLALFAVVGLGLVVVVDAGNHSQTMIQRGTAENRAMRSSTLDLVDEMRSSSDSRITVTTLTDGNNAVRFLMPLQVGGVTAWGVSDRSLGSDAASQNRANWSIRYTVRNSTDEHGNATKLLVRQILDDGGVMQRERVVAGGVRSGTDSPPGFKVINTGEVWEVTLSTNGRVEGRSGMREVFHVQTRN